LMARRPLLRSITGHGPARPRGPRVSYRSRSPSCDV
jgi:hypothetical protein